MAFYFVFLEVVFIKGMTHKTAICCHLVETNMRLRFIQGSIHVHVCSYNIKLQGIHSMK